MRSIFLWILLLLIIIYITNSKIYEGYITYTKYDYIDYPGNDILQQIYPFTKPQCEQLCNTTSLCVGYVTDFIFGKGPGKCWLKKKMKDANPRKNKGKVNTGRISYIRSIF